MSDAAAQIREDLHGLRRSLESVLAALPAIKGLLSKVRIDKVRAALPGVDTRAFEETLKTMHTGCQALSAVQNRVIKTLGQVAPDADDVARDVARVLEKNSDEGPLGGRSILVFLPEKGYTRDDIETACKTLVKKGRVIPVSGGYRWKNPRAKK